MFTGIPAGAQPGGQAVVWVLRVLVVAGLVAMAVAWAEASNTVQVSSQVDWAPVGLAGVAAVTSALLGSVMIARQAVAVRIAHLVPFIAGSADVAADPVGAIPVSRAVPAATGSGGSEPLVAAASMARYHRASCPLTAGKPVRPAGRDVHEQAGRQACGVCAP